MKLKQVVEISKCYSNPTRVEILEWLKNPDENFPPNETQIPNREGVCMSYIHEKSGLSQSTISTYLASMERCGLLTSTRLGKWSYFRRNEQVIQEFSQFINNK
ncbi:MAG: helix-turn-helix domain-containing protein [Weeksellaceae bacterium]|nr:helix-turn-helix domain-containing protein [Weeksellaceae bacterium]